MTPSLNAQSLPAFDAAATATLLDFAQLVDALDLAAREHVAGKIVSPVRTGTPLAEGGVLLSMLASADDIAIHKLVSVCPANARQNLPTIFGTVTACNGQTGKPEFVLDGPTLTGRRTAALSMLGVRKLHESTPRDVLIIGSGQQAAFHAQAVAALYPAALIRVKGFDDANEQAFCARLKDAHNVTVEPLGGAAIPASVDTVITVTTSKTPVYTEAARAGRLVIGVGAFTPDAAEIGPNVVEASEVYVDDLAATQAEAGDLLQAGIDWSRVQAIGAVDAGATKSSDKPKLLKTVGSGAWDLAACRVARVALAK